MKHRFRFPLVLLTGILLLGAGLLGLSAGPKLVQYAVLPGSADETDVLTKLETVRSALAETFPLITLHGQKNGVSLTAGNVTQNDVCLYLTGPSWSEVYPRRFLSGRPVSRVDAEQGEHVIVLDQATAFRLFGDHDPLGETVTLGDKKLEVIGVAEHSRRIGETGAYAAWIPLGTAADCELLVLTAPAPADSSLLSMFRTNAEEVFGNGTMISLPKEKSGATMLLRLVLIILAVWGLKKWVSVLGGFCCRQIGRIREESGRRYAGRLLPYALWQMLPAVLLVAVTIGVGYALAVFAAEPMRIFPEWVPESLGDFSSWISRFWNLTGDAAKSVNLQTAEAAEIHFWSGLVQTGIVLALLGGYRVYRNVKQKETD